jgi:uncharacterized damage-inducible protein DinB
MIARIKLVTELYTVSERLALKAFGEMKPEDMYVRPNDKANSFHWVFGHITSSRYGLAKALGLNEDFAWEKLYDMGADVYDASAYPSIDELHAAFLSISTKLKARFETLTEADLEIEPPFSIPGVEKSTAGTLAFLSLHESYHVGQLAYILRLHGRAKLVG